MLGKYIIGEKTTANGIKCQVVMEVKKYDSQYVTWIILKPTKVGKIHPEYDHIRNDFGDDFDFDISHKYKSILSERQIRKIHKIFNTIPEPKHMAR